MKSLSYVYKLFQAMQYFRGFAPRKPIYFRRQSAANSIQIQIRYVFCFGAYSRAESPDILNRAQWWKRRINCPQEKKKNATEM